MGKNVCWKFFKIHLQGSTVPEVIISLTICLIIFSISMRFVLKMLTGDNLITRQKAELLISHPENNAVTADPDGVNPALVKKGNLLVFADTVSAENYPQLQLVTRRITLSDGRVIRQSGFYIRNRKSANGHEN